MSLSPSGLTVPAFDRLLQRLDPDRARAGEKYELLHAKLVKFFQWRGSSAPEEQADACLDRLLQRLARDEDIENVEAFVSGVARMILLEGRRQEQRRLGMLARVSWIVEPAQDGQREASDRCLESCLDHLPPDERALIIGYYGDEGSGRIAARKQLAARLGVPPAVLRLRAHRIRARLEACLRRCLGRPAPGQAEVAGWSPPSPPTEEE